MVANPDRKFMTPQEYFDWEEQQPIKYEYINGKVFARSEEALTHNSIIINLASALNSHTRGKGCRVFMIGAKLGVSENGSFHYPDVMVTCDERDRRAIKAIYYPCLIAEVFSSTTESFDSPTETLRDRGKKLQQYRRISTLKEYVLISAEEIIIECFRLNERGSWELSTYAEGEEVYLSSVDFRCAIELLYEDVVFEGTETQF